MAGDGNGTGAAIRKASGKNDTARSQPITVLIVDDERTFGEALEVALGREKDLRIVHVATDGPQGVRAAGRHHPDVVLVDAAMPGMSGIEATRRIKEVDPETAILILSGQGDEHLLARGQPLEALAGVVVAVAPVPQTPHRALDLDLVVERLAPVRAPDRARHVHDRLGLGEQARRAGLHGSRE